MTLDQMNQLVVKYWEKEAIPFPKDFEHRFEEKSSAQMYSLIRQEKPVSVLEIGSSRGGSTNVIMAALQKNGKPFKFISSELLDDLRESARWHVLRERGVEPEMIGDITQNLDKIPKKIDFLFLDDDHDLSTTQWIVENIFPRLKKGSIFVMHDWAVNYVDGRLAAKDGCWPETEYLLGLILTEKFPFDEELFTFVGQGSQETGFWRKK